MRRDHNHHKKAAQQNSPTVQDSSVAASAPAARGVMSLSAIKTSDHQRSITDEELWAIRQMQCASLIRLKRLDGRAVAAAIGMPYENVRQAIEGEAQAMRKSDWERLMEISGFDLETGRLNRNFPHFIHVDDSRIADLRCISGLMADAKAARIQCNERRLLGMFSKGPSLTVIQNDHVRIVCIEHTKMSSMSHIPDCQWARKSEEDSIVKTALPADRFIKGDLTSTEFDDLFSRGDRMTLDRIEILARANHVTFEEIAEFIQQRGDQKERDRLTRMRTVGHEEAGRSVAHG